MSFIRHVGFKNNFSKKIVRIKTRTTRQNIPSPRKLSLASCSPAELASVLFSGIKIIVFLRMVLVNTKQFVNQD
jgi:hypothetical protein